MLKTDRELELAKKQLSKLHELHAEQLAELIAKGLGEEEATDLLSSSLTYANQCQEDVELYEKLKRGELPEEESFSSRGRYFVAARIARGMTQRELAEKLETKESGVCRDERNEYHGISMAKMDKICAILRLKVKVWLTA